MNKHAPALPSRFHPKFTGFKLLFFQFYPVFLFLHRIVQLGISILQSFRRKWQRRSLAPLGPGLTGMFLIWRRWTLLTVGTPLNGPRLRFLLAFCLLFGSLAALRLLTHCSFSFFLFSFSLLLQPVTRSVSRVNLDCLLEAEQVIAEVRTGPILVLEF